MVVMSRPPPNNMSSVEALGWGYPMPVRGLLTLGAVCLAAAGDSHSGRNNIVQIPIGGIRALATVSPSSSS